MHARIVAALSAAFLLAACGGSSSKPPPPPPAGRSMAYAGSTASASLSASTDKNALAASAAGLAQGFSGFAGGAMGFTGGPTAMSVAAGPSRPSFVKQALLIAADARHRSAALAAAPVGLVSTATGPCDGGGSATIAYNDADGLSSTTTSGDYVELSFASCDDGYGNVTHGSLRITFETSGGDFVADPTAITTDASVGLTIAYRDFWTVDPNAQWSGLNGDMSVSFLASLSQQALEYQVSGTSIEGATGVGDTVTDAFRIAALAGGDGKYHDLARELYTGMGTVAAARTEGQWDLDARMCTLEWHGCLNVLTDPTFAEHEGALYPYTGTLRVSDDAGDFVQVAATDENGSVTLSWDLGAASYGTVYTTWGCLDGTAVCN